MDSEDRLKELGFVYNVHSGFQFDLNTVLQKGGNGYFEGHWCNNSCTTTCGNYDCPAAFTRNKNIDTSTMMSFIEIKEALSRARGGLEKMNKIFLKEIFPSYVKNFKIPKKVAGILHKTLKNGEPELNLFGGNPEIHPDFLKIIKAAKKIGWKVTTTTTGKKFLSDPSFLDKFLEDPPNLLAFSADDYENIEELKHLLGFSLRKLKIFWQKVNPLYGQRKKAYESIYVAKLAKKTKGFCLLLFNMVVHPGNLDYIEKMMDMLHKAFPIAIINPYPAQSSFLYRDSVWGKEHLSKLEKFIDLMIEKQVNQVGVKRKTFVPRLKYWLLLKSISLIKTNDEKRLEFLSGNHVWTCFRTSGAGRYLQAGSSTEKVKKTDRVGGHPGCFWNNRTVTDSRRQLWSMSTQEIASYILKDKVKIAKKTKKPCPGCIMPRLLFDGISTELGMSPELLPIYMNLRKRYFKF